MTLEEYIRRQEMIRGFGGGLTTPHYLGNVVSGRRRMTRPPWMTDAQVDYYSRPSQPVSGFNFLGRPPRSFYDPNAVNPEAAAARQAYADVARHRATQTSPLPMGLPSGYGQEEGGMEFSLPQRPSGTFSQRYPRLMKDVLEGEAVVPPAVDIRREPRGPTRGIEAEEGPASGFSASALSKAAEMIKAAGAGGAGSATKVGGDQVKAPGPWMAGPKGITAFAPVDLRAKKKREDDIYG